MLKIIKIRYRSQVDAIFESYDPNHCTWLVSDLRTKFELQESILNKNSSYTDESVYRASDMWKLILRRSEPRLKIVSDSFIRSLLRAILDEHGEALGGISSTSEETVYAHLDKMASMIFHPEGVNLLDKWFEENPESKSKWQEWFLRARFVGVKLINEHKVISQRWITSWLQNESNIEKFWDRPLIVDLSGELSRAEAELLKAISRVTDVTVLQPFPEWHEDFKYLLQPYQWLETQTKDIQILEHNSPIVSAKSTLRLSGMLAEVKEATSSVRKWLDEGVSAKSILITAPDIEIYWPVLQAFFEVEGIPMNKAVAGKLQSLPSVSRWMSQLRVRSGRLKTTDLELSFYENEKAQELRFEKFKSIYNSLYVEEDLNRHALIKEIFSGKFDSHKVVARDTFVGQALLYWNSSDSEQVQLVLRELLSNATDKVRLSWNEWLKYLESIVAVKEWSIKKADSHGVTMTKLMSAGSTKFTHRIFLGLAEEQLKAKTKIQLSGAEYFSLAKDIGFVLNNPDVSDLDFELCWISDIESQNDLYCFGGADFTGYLQAPSMFWTKIQMQKAMTEEALHTPELCRWDEIQHQDHILSERLKNDLGISKQEAFKAGRSLSMSPSGIEAYQKCPFVFAAGRIFRLEDHPDIEMDVDPRIKGNLAHLIFEKLTQEPMRFDWSESELEKLVDDARIEKALMFAAEELWIPIKKKNIALAKRFLMFEENLRKKFPAMKVLGKEKDLKAWYDLDKGKFSATETPNSIAMTGRLDRVDGDGQQMIIYDYKSSEASSPTTNRWITELKLQMPFYMWALEKINEPPFLGKVDAALYYIFKDFKLKGFTVNERAGKLYDPIKSTARNTIANDDSGKEKLFAEFEKLAGDKIKEVSGGLFAPNPVKPDECPKCQWRSLCRAQHLS